MNGIFHPKRLKLAGFSIFLVVVVIPALLFFLCKPSVYRMFIDVINPSFETISSAEIEEDRVLVLDTRSKPEFEVSHLPNALWVGFEAFEVSKITHFPKDTAIVVYCSIGYRSALIGQDLAKAGFTNVKNLYGGIFEWQGEGHPIVNSMGNETDTLHGFSPFWGVWVRKGTVIYSKEK